MAVNDPFSGSGSDALGAVIQRGCIILDTLKTMLHEHEENPDRTAKPHEYAEIVEGVGVFGHLTWLCDIISKGKKIHD